MSYRQSADYHTVSKDTDPAEKKTSFPKHLFKFIKLAVTAAIFYIIIFVLYSISQTPEGSKLIVQSFKYATGKPRYDPTNPDVDAAWEDRIVVGIVALFLTYAYVY